MAETDCGVTFTHDPHGYRTPRGKVKACDGSTTKRATTPSAPESATDPSACVEGGAS